jgi:hypothetical protein
MFSVTEEARAWNSDAPPSVGGSPVVLQLRVEDVDSSFEGKRPNDRSLRSETGVLDRG